MATRDAQAARRSLLINVFSSIGVNLLLPCVGLSLLAFFRTYPEYLPTGQTIAQSADRLFPHFIATQLPVGIAGLVVSECLRPPCRVLIRGLTRLAPYSTPIFLKRLRLSSFSRQPGASDDPLAAERESVRIAKWTALAVGVFVIAASGFDRVCSGELLGGIQTRSRSLRHASLYPLRLCLVRSLRNSDRSAVRGDLWIPERYRRGVLETTFRRSCDQFYLDQPTAFLVAIAVGTIVSWLTRPR